MAKMPLQFQNSKLLYSMCVSLLYSLASTAWALFLFPSLLAIPFTITPAQSNSIRAKKFFFFSSLCIFPNPHKSTIRVINFVLQLFVVKTNFSLSMKKFRKKRSEILCWWKWFYLGQCNCIGINLVRVQSYLLYGLSLQIGFINWS